jgi:hypothetical protein
LILGSISATSFKEIPHFPDPRRVPGEALVDQAGAGQGTGVAANAPLHARRAQNFHVFLPSGKEKFHHRDHRDHRDFLANEKENTSAFKYRPAPILRSYVLALSFYSFSSLCSL